MRRRWFGAVLTATILSTTAGCTGPARFGDGDLTNDWPAIDTVTSFVPDVGFCHTESGDVGSRADYDPVDCGRPHLVETVFVGTFAGVHAAGDTAPRPGSPERTAARGVCDQRVKGFLGDYWQAGRVRLQIVLPSAPAWAGGARWYRCDVGEMTSMADRTFVSRTSSLAGALGPDGPLRWGCFQPESVTDDGIGNLRPVACSQPHQSEFAGLYVEDALSYDYFADNSVRVHERCRAVVAGFARLPVDGDLRFRFGTIYDYPFRDEWDEGNKTVRCLLWREDPPLVGTARNGGTAFLPIRFG
ncbi:septum formation family protein [Solwaraspora sp. WMMD406]|uniref:septum formation family protein n=1 Tax=Solwaraspora sp. WMMD406 TaxID=3016095 RepID=UPI0024171D91|nr:septum formation family protein [Solwaraspora sp. WMMD406]MDG4766480.1 septum formation family protein [Solwaraspora sp. WMMD406]